MRTFSDTLKKLLTYAEDNRVSSPVKFDPKILVKLKDIELLELADSIHGNLIRDEISEEEFNVLREQIGLELQARGIRPAGETPRGKFSESVTKALSETPIRCSTAFLGIDQNSTICWNADRLKDDLKVVALRLAKLLPDDVIAKFSSKGMESGQSLFDLYLVPSGKSIRVAKERVDGPAEDVAYFQQIASASRKDMSGARSTAKNDEVVVGRFIRTLPLSRGACPEVRQTVEGIAHQYADEVFPVHVIPTATGAHVQLHKSKNRVDIWTQDGENITSLLPGLSRELSSRMADDVVLLGTLDVVDVGHVRGSHLFDALRGRSSNASFFFTAYDCLYKNEDIHHLTFSERYEILKKLVADSRENRVFSLCCHEPKIANSPKHLIPTLNYIRKRSDFSGALICDNFHYELSNYRRGHITLFEKDMLVNAIVLDVKETDTPGVVKYEIGVSAGTMNFEQEDIVERDGKAYVKLGLTLPTARCSYPGDILEVSTRCVNFDHNLPTDGCKLCLTEPRVVNRVNDRTFPFSASSLMENAMKANLLSCKTVEQGGSVCYRNGMSETNPLKATKWTEDDRSIKLAIAGVDRFEEGSIFLAEIGQDEMPIELAIGNLKGSGKKFPGSFSFSKQDGWSLAKAQKWVESKMFRDYLNRPTEDYVEPADDSTNRS